jgi:hypothetical protein
MEQECMGREQGLLKEQREASEVHSKLKTVFGITMIVIANAVENVKAVLGKLAWGKCTSSCRALRRLLGIYIPSK